MPSFIVALGLGAITFLTSLVSLTMYRGIGDLDSNLIERARQGISEAMRRKVLHRDQQRCQVPGCRAHRNLDVHHLLHVEHGGTNEYSNMTTLCGLCRARHNSHYAGCLVMPGRAVTSTVMRSFHPA